MTEDREARETIAFEKRGAAGWIIFSRPERMNALTPESVREIWTVLARMEADSSARVAVFSGKGESSFCAGMDLAGLERSSPLAARRRSREMQMLTNRIAEFSLPTVAAVNGIAMGLGLEICLACDLAVAVPSARFGFAEVILGMIPSGGGTQRLPRLVGLRRAREMILAGRILEAGTALDWGLVNSVVQPEDLAQRVQDMAERLAQGGKISLFQAKRCLNHSLDMDLNRGLEYEAEFFATCFSTGEPARGLKRFTEHGREPDRGSTGAATAKEEAPPEYPSEVKEAGGEEQVSGDLEEDEDIFE